MVRFGDSVQSEKAFGPGTRNPLPYLRAVRTTDRNPARQREKGDALQRMTTDRMRCTIAITMAKAIA
jgi:hypothetical protein